MTVTEALDGFPPGLRQGLGIAYDEGGRMAYEMLARGDMPPQRALLAGLALEANGRALFENALDAQASVDDEIPANVGEVVIGAGAHAAIYAAVRKQMGFGTPLVLSPRMRFGGTFAMSSKSAFYLNSRNRPGGLGNVGSRDALNVIPGAIMQPSDMGGAEYQANADLGLVVRCTLVLNAVVRQAKVTELTMNGGTPILVTNRGLIRAKRVIVATGLWNRKSFNGAPTDNKRVFSFDGFMRRFDKTMFPLRDLGRVAVVGGGDSGRTVVEALTGYGPYMGGSVASLDYVPQIDWYGIEPNMTKERWLECNRTRYKPLAALFPKQVGDTRNARVRGFDKARVVYPAYDAIRVNTDAYDTVITCTGYVRDWRAATGADPQLTFDLLRSNQNDDRGASIAQVNRVAPNTQPSIYVVGPAAELPYEQIVDGPTENAENQVALFRLAPRTAALAARLPAV